MKQQRNEFDANRALAQRVAPSPADRRAAEQRAQREAERQEIMRRILGC